MRFDRHYFVDRGLRGNVKLLLTSGGITNNSLENALVELLGKPIADASALFIPTAVYGQRNAIEMAWRVLTGEGMPPMVNLGWKSVGILELISLPSAGRDTWKDVVRATDALLVWGGDPMFLHYWMRESGLAELLPTLPEEMVYVGMSAGSMVLTPDIGEDFVRWNAPTGGHRTLGLVNFSIFPHLDHPMLPDNSMAAAEKWASELSGPAYVMDDATAIKVVDGTVEVVSEGHWKLLNS
jgi:dipeptidase E